MISALSFGAYTERELDSYEISRNVLRMKNLSDAWQSYIVPIVEAAVARACRMAQARNDGDWQRYYRSICKQRRSSWQDYQARKRVFRLLKRAREMRIMRERLVEQLIESGRLPR